MSNQTQNQTETSSSDTIKPNQTKPNQTERIYNSVFKENDTEFIQAFHNFKKIENERMKKVCHYHKAIKNGRICNSCKVTFSTPTAMRSHMKTKKHKKLLELEKLEKELEKVAQNGFGNVNEKLADNQDKSFIVFS